MRRWPVVAAALLALAGAVCAEESPLLREARTALDESIPQVAVHKLLTLLSSPRISATDRSVGRQMLGQALLAAGQPSDALVAIEGLEGRDPSLVLLRANVLAALGRWSEALSLYQEAASKLDAPLTAQLGEAESLKSLGRITEAITVLQRVTESGRGGVSARLRLASLLTERGDRKRAGEILSGIVPASNQERKWKRYIDGRLLLAEGQADPARMAFEEILRDSENLSEELLFGATLGLAESRIVLNGYESAERVLEKFISSRSQSPYLEQAFQRLDQIYSAEESPTEGDLHKWAQKAPARRAALARFYVARMQLRERKFEKAALSLASFVQSYPKHPLLTEAHLMQADHALSSGRLADAIRALEAAMRQVKSSVLRGEIELRTGLVHFQQREYLLAANLFRSAGQRAPKLKPVAAYNAALCWVHQGNDERFYEELRALGNDAQGDGFRSALLLEQGLHQARVEDARAEETLQLYLRQYPGHPRMGEARLALAELAFRALQSTAAPAPEARQRATEYMQVANITAGNPDTAEHAEYLAIFLADSQQPRDDEKIIRQATLFLEAHPQSVLVPEVRMKLGQVYFRREDFANAETQFAILAKESPQSAYAEAALFLAGQAAMKMMNPGAFDRGLAFFDQVVRRDGPLKLYARQEQAIAQRSVGHESEAIALYDIILAAQPGPDPELRYAALCGKGDNLLSLGRNDRAKIEAAIGVFEQLAAVPSVSPTWRNQALYKKGQALERLGRPADAVTAFHDVLAFGASADREYFWYYKAGFDAARLLEQQEQWKSAIGVYDKMAKLGGPRAAEAQARSKELRLTHFVWD